MKYVPQLKALCFLLALLPVAKLFHGAFTNNLGANPIEYITRDLGTWGLTFLLITLSITPLRRFTNWNWLLRLRRMLGLFAFFYIVLHFVSYIWWDQFFDWAAIWKDIRKRPFITVGFAAFLMLLPLAVTSTNKMIKRLGAQRWQLLHRLVYAIAVCGVVHYWWLVKRDVTKPLIYGLILAFLLGLRLVYKHVQSRKAKPATVATPQRV
jgi:sulfoxide reductase heme-binding subunit YedZ